MVIDIHAHVTAPQELYAYKAGLLSHRGAHGRGKVNVSDDLLKQTLEAPVFGGGSHLQQLREVGTDMQLISPRPYTMMHSETDKLVRWFIEETNNIIARECALYPDTFKGVCGLPQTPGASLDAAVAELDRTVKEFGFVGCLINPDPTEGAGPEPPGLGDEYWYPLYEKLVALDVPALVHSAGCRSGREPYSLHFINEESIAIVSLLSSKVFEDFPKLKLIISHGGGAIPYQVGRYRSMWIRRKLPHFDDCLKQLYFDTCLYSAESLELLFKIVGPERCMFGTEKPGIGSSKNRETGAWLDDIKPVIDGLSILSAADREMIYEGNAKRVFRLEA